MDELGIIEVCTAFDLKYSRTYENARRGPQMQISCPLAFDGTFHSSTRDESPSLSVTVDPEQQSLCYCHGASCGYRGTFLNLIRKAIQIRTNGRIPADLKALLERVKELESTSLSKVMGVRKTRITAAPTTLSAALKVKQKINPYPEDRLEAMDPTYHPYATKRGISEESWKRWGMRFDSSRACIVFPVRTMQGVLSGLVGRSIADVVESAKKNYPGLNKAENFFGAQFMTNGKPVVIVEGPIDCVNVDTFLSEKASVVATLGQGFSDTQSTMIRSVKPPVVYVFPDGDRGGKLIGQKIVHALSRHVILKIMRAPSGEDPGSLKGDVIKDLFENAERIKNFKDV